MRGCVSVFFVSKHILGTPKQIYSGAGSYSYTWHWLGMLIFAVQKCVHSTDNKQGALQGACACASAINSFW
jgi:hypothetical protein